MSALPSDLFENHSATLWIALGSTIAVWLLQFYWRRRHLYTLSSKVPGPAGWPLIGSVLDFTGNIEDIFDSIMEHFDAFPELFKVWYGPNLVYAVTKPEYIERILGNHKLLRRHDLMGYIAEAFGTSGLFSGPVPLWKRHRKILAPTFNGQVLNGYVEIFQRHAAVLAGHLLKRVGGGVFDAYPLMSACTLDTICETAMGITMDAQTSGTQFGHWIERLMEIAWLRMFVAWYRPDFLFKRTNLYKEEQELLRNLNGFIEGVIRERQNRSEEREKSFLDFLLGLTNGETQWSETEVRDEVKTFMIGGSDTIANTLGYVFVMLGMHPDVQHRLVDEVLQVVGPDAPVEAHHLPSLKFTDRVIKETMRLFPVGGILGREVDVDVPITDDVVLPKGSSVLIGVLNLHRDPKVYPQPFKFDPDRFSPEEVDKRHAYAFLPFSKGPRNCIGFGYAQMALKTVVATVARKVRFSTPFRKVEDVKLKTCVMVKPADGYRIGVKPRDVTFSQCDQ